MANILCFGDSITFGLLDSRGGWVQRIRTDLEKASTVSGFKKWYEVYNVGIPGDATVNLIDRFEEELKPRRDKLGSDNVVIFAVGINDSIQIAGNKKPFSTPQLYKEQLNKLVDIAKKHTNKIMFVGLTPVDESLVNPFGQSTTGKSYNNTTIKEFDDILREFCKEHNHIFVDIFPAFMAKDYKNLLGDGLHPNDKGHKLMASLIKPVLLKQLSK